MSIPFGNPGMSWHVYSDGFVVVGVAICCSYCWLQVLSSRISCLDDVLGHIFRPIGPSDGVLHCLGLSNSGNVLHDSCPKTFVEVVSFFPRCKQGPP